MAARSKPFCLWTSRWELCASLALSLSRDSVRGIAAHVRLCHICTGTVKASGEKRESPSASIGPRQACPAGRPDLTDPDPDHSQGVNQGRTALPIRQLTRPDGDGSASAVCRQFIAAKTRYATSLGSAARSEELHMPVVCNLPWDVTWDVRFEVSSMSRCHGGRAATSKRDGREVKFGPTCH